MVGSLVLLLQYIHLTVFSRTTWVSQHQKGKPFWTLLEQEMMGWQWHQQDHMQIICTSLQTDNHASISPLDFLQAACPSCHPTNSVKALKAIFSKNFTANLLLKVICNGFSQNWWKVVSSCLLQYKPVCAINFDKLRRKMLKRTTLVVCLV